jgi:orotate phosphoribosyltransferase
MSIEYHIAKILLEKKAVTLNTVEPYTYVSGIRSPIYCDNRALLFFSDARKEICQAFMTIIRELNPEVIAGVATSAIPWAAWVAEALEMPMVYIRKAAKGYGKAKRIEGGDIAGKRVVVIEDLVSTAGSSLNAVEACRETGAEVAALVGIFTYQFKTAWQKFSEANCNTKFLTDFTTLAQVAVEHQFIEQEQLTIIQAWNQDPGSWGPKHGFPNRT